MKKTRKILICIVLCLILMLCNINNTFYAVQNVSSNAKSVTKLKNLVVFIKFSNSTDVHHIDDEQSIANAEKIFNSDELFEMESVNGKIEVPSFKKYYEMQSYGKLSISTQMFPKKNGKVVSYEDTKPIEYYLNNTNNPQGYENKAESVRRETELINRAVGYVSEQIRESGITSSDLDTNNDDKVDAISFVIEGKKNLPTTINFGELLWSHNSTSEDITNNILGKKLSSYSILYASDYTESAGLFSLNRGTYGTIIHEFGHTLGLMDLYKYNNSNSNPVGFFDIMSNTIGSNPQDFLTYFTTEYNNQTNWHAPMPVINETTTDIKLYKPKYQDSNEQRAIKIKNVDGPEYFIAEYYEKKNTYNTHTTDSSGIIVYRVNEDMKYHGNNGISDNIFIFRPGETTLNEGKGDLTKATLNSTRPVLGKALNIDDNTFCNDTIYYSDGKNSGIIIEVTEEKEDYIMINVTFPKTLGEGTKEAPYIINDVDSFMYLMGLDSKEKYYEITSDLDFKNVEKFPKIVFEGNLEGNNKTLKNIESEGTGLFERVGDFYTQTVIKNLKVENMNVHSTSKGMHTGGFAGMADNVILENIHLTNGMVANENAQILNDLLSTGGFVGSANSNVIIQNCSSTLDVKSSNIAGGFIGINQNAIIKECMANCNVDGKNKAGAFIGVQCITDENYNVPQNAYYIKKENSKTGAVGGYSEVFHNKNALPIDSLSIGITEKEQEKMLGDVNGDGKINLIDYTKILSHVKKTKLLIEEEKALADINKDGKINLIDYTRVLAIVKGRR